MYVYTELVNSCGRTQETLTLRRRFQVLQKSQSEPHGEKVMKSRVCSSSLYKSAAKRTYGFATCTTKSRVSRSMFVICYLYERSVYIEREREKDVFKQMNLIEFDDLI